MIAYDSRLGVFGPNHKSLGFRQVTHQKILLGQSSHQKPVLAVKDENSFDFLDLAELPSLDDAASDVYDQKLLFEMVRPNGKLTGLDLLMNVFRDIEASKADLSRGAFRTTP